METRDDDRDEDFDGDFTVGEPPRQGHTQGLYDEEEDIDNSGDGESDDYDKENTNDFFQHDDDGENSMLAMNQHLSALNLTGESFHNEEEEEEEEEEIISTFPSVDEFNLLSIAPELRSMVQEVFSFQSQKFMLPAPLKPFIPEYQPAIGEVDSFVKVQRPDGVGDLLGLVVLDEPGPEQSNPSVLEMQLRNLDKLSDVKQPTNVRTVDANDRGAMGLQSWINSIEEFHKSRPSPSVAYRGPMPSPETLMQVWPPEFENQLKHTKIPPLHQLDMSIADYSKLILSLLNIPVYDDSVKESLHLLFSLYSAFKENPHFKDLDLGDLLSQTKGH
ncbi:putative Intraflagellar transport protein 46 like protein [Blattamonas nauphoetae]|uniref:Intraflagellar transport protein 46 like protein n=1 Tax=Blattamonas nauphoetae TaxID=2049346 RepID=A0ABQ9XSW5_9EUKA|nr:putative Intraflagellar transport protein 46 like protein [Blattamonas nauphoetae]